MKRAGAALCIVAGPFLVALTAQSPTGMEPFSRAEARLETIVNRDGGPVSPCEVVLAISGTQTVAWSALGEAGTGVRCGRGSFPAGSAEAAGTIGVPALILEISLSAGWDAAAMDPGPGRGLQISLTLTSRRPSGLSPNSKPVYSNPVNDRRLIRLEEGEEYLLPVAAASTSGGETPGFHEVLLRIRAGWAGWAGATRYGALAVMGAAPGSEILVDGGAAGRAGSDGSFLLASVPVGQREVRLRGPAGPVVSRWVSVVNGKTVVVSPGPTAAGASMHPFAKPAGKNSQGFPEYQRMRDGAVMVQIPEGDFLMGNLKTEGSPLPHTVYVSSFLIDKLPVTVARYKSFAAATGRPLPPDPYWGVHDDFPVAFVRWDEARAYCEWVGGRLPTEAEREKAARGTDGRLWPWGEEPPPNPQIAVFRRNWGELGPDRVGIRPGGASPYGLLDSGGNMWEWVEDWWDPDYFKSSPKKDPPGPKTGRARVVKGGSWDSRPTVLSASSRNFGYIGYREGDFGFRCAADAPR